MSDEVSLAVRKITGTSLPPARSADDLEAVQVRKHTSSTIRSGRARLRLPQRIVTVNRGGYRAAVELQRDLHKLADVRLVVYDEHPGDTVVSWHGVSGSLWPNEKRRRGGQALPLRNA